MRRNAARGRLKVGGVVERFQEEQGVSGQLLLNKPWPVSIRLQELIRHETGRARVRDGGHWVTKRAESGQEGLRFYTASGSLNAAQKLKDIYWKTNKWRNQMIPSETNLPQFWRHPPTNTQPFHPDLLSPNRSTSLTTETDTLVSRSLVIYSVVVFVVGPLHWKEKKTTSESSAPRHLPSYKSHYTDRTLDHSPLFTVISGVLLFRVDSDFWWTVNVATTCTDPSEQLE